MKQIRLTDKEIDKIMARAGRDKVSNINMGAEWVAKTQFKRIVDMLQECDGDLVSRNNKPFMATFEMLAEDWEALLKEVK